MKKVEISKRTLRLLVTCFYLEATRTARFYRISIDAAILTEADTLERQSITEKAFQRVINKLSQPIFYGPGGERSSNEDAETTAQASSPHQQQTQDTGRGEKSEER
ncbi:MAG: hypothetical protein VKL39_00920 [Leptolyngbyaceae bacterium]|nr:hypothetical protein [Leptolyngbyaceae bacterium]